jgi:uncharacterized membrane protein YdjX (TVP38/TMEM64 family)
MKRYAVAGAALCLFMLALFGLAQLLDVPVLADESPDLGSAGAGAALAGVALLVGDVLLPVPSSAVMIANGALFGPVVGALLSLVGSQAAALVGFAIGRRGGPLLERAVSPAQRERTAAALERRGAVAVVVSRPVPVVAETVTILAGASGMPLRRFALAALVGSLPPAVAYALAGSLATRFSESVVVFAGVLLLAGLFWFAERRMRVA